MSKLVQTLKDAGYAHRLFTDRQLARLVDGGDARRYGLVNRALKDGSLTRIKRGLYALGGPDTQSAPHPFAVAQALVPGSYVSFETALSYHGWIPEAVYTTASVNTGRKTLTRDTERFGHFSFHPLAIAPYQFLVSVDRIGMGKSVALVAQPLRALMDLVALRKANWAGLDWIEQGLRIERSRLTALQRSDFDALRDVYKHRQVRLFLGALEQAVMGLRQSGSLSGKGNDD
tara:strand:- start:800 stop:1492 length:693 start_codon:yes stop_codon:yes gene_type:complete